MHEDCYAAHKVAEIAAAMLDGSVRPLLGALMLIGYLHRLKNEIDPEILRFIRGVSSECDGLPIGPERQYWAPQALVEKDRKADAYEKAIRADLLEAAARMREQFLAKASLE